MRKKPLLGLSMEGGGGLVKEFYIQEIQQVKKRHTKNLMALVLVCFIVYLSDHFIDKMVYHQLDNLFILLPT